MQLATVDTAGARRWGVIADDAIRLAPTDGTLAQTLLGFIAAGEALPDTGAWEARSLDTVTLAAPIPEPRRNVMCLGLNYADHAAESQGTAPGEAKLPDYPVVFTKATTSVTGPRAEVVVDARATRRLDWEVELAVVIGRGGRFIAADDAMAHVFGYTIVNDLSARERQKSHQQFFLGKSMDGSCPMGPWLTTADAVADPHALAIRSAVNGVVKQDSNTRHLIFRIPDIIAELSSVMTLLPGDVIATGTPSGVGFARNPPEYLGDGDVVECHIEGLGWLRNTIVGPRAA
ncbi:MAG: fumarylacetoacetate hydrolase family protein [Halofilum sp. (in: g-proteobacteria)]|nr:fumarylacetoacetate hydrolase family protein [Halofilum sp. (in: g-proteobacteria)]